MRGYAVIIEADNRSFSAYSPDLPGCVAAGKTLDEVKRLMGQAIDLHIESLRRHNEPIPEPTSTDAYITAPAA